MAGCRDFVAQTRFLLIWGGWRSRIRRPDEVFTPRVYYIRGYVTHVLPFIIAFMHVSGIYDFVRVMSVMAIDECPKVSPLSFKAMSPKSVDEFGLPKPCPWHCHELLWQECSPEDASFASAVRYLNTRMFKDRNLEPIQDVEEFNQVAYTLTQYRNKNCDVGPENLEYYHEMTQKNVFECVSEKKKLLNTCVRDFDSEYEEMKVGLANHTKVLQKLVDINREVHKLLRSP